MSLLVAPASWLCLQVPLPLSTHSGLPGSSSELGGGNEEPDRTVSPFAGLGCILRHIGDTSPTLAVSYLTGRNEAVGEGVCVQLQEEPIEIADSAPVEICRVGIVASDPAA